MKSGDYMIHVLIEKMEKINPEDGNGSLDALLHLETCGMKNYSSVKKDVRTEVEDHSVIWNEHIYFEPRNLDGSYIDEQQLVIRLLNQGFLKNDLIGEFSFDIATIYRANDEHTLRNQWIAMNLPSSANYKEIRALLRVSVAVQGPGDPSVKLEGAQGFESTEKHQIMMPLSITRQYKEFSIGILTAQNLPKMDELFTRVMTSFDLNCFVRLKWMGKSMRTKTVDRSADAKDKKIVFNQMFTFGVPWPSAVDRITLRVMDADYTTADDMIGSIYFSVREIVEKYSDDNAGFAWVNIYGGPPEVSNEFADQMNENPEAASNWQGRILVYLKARDEEHPKLEVSHLDQQLITAAKPFFELNEYEVMAELSAGICLPKPGNKAVPYRVGIKIGEHLFVSGKPK